MKLFKNQIEKRYIDFIEASKNEKEIIIDIIIRNRISIFFTLNNIDHEINFHINRFPANSLITLRINKGIKIFLKENWIKGFCRELIKDFIINRNL